MTFIECIFGTSFDFSGLCTNLRYGTLLPGTCATLYHGTYILSPPCNLFWNSLHVGSFDWQMVCWQLEWCPWKWLLSPLHPDYCSFPTNHKMNVLRLVLLFPICLTFPLNPFKNLLNQRSNEWLEIKCSFLQIEFVAKALEICKRLLQQCKVIRVAEKEVFTIEFIQRGHHCQYQKVLSSLKGNTVSYCSHCCRLHLLRQL